MLAAAAMQDPLSDRERECLFWVSEGKTTDEVALILGVSSNTVNSYVTHAIQKLVGQQPRHGDRHGNQERHHLKQAEVKEVAQSLFSEPRNPFGAFSLGSETHRTVDHSRCRPALPLDRRRSQRCRLRPVLRRPVDGAGTRWCRASIPTTPASAAETTVDGRRARPRHRQARPNLDGAVLVERRRRMRLVAWPSSGWTGA